MPSVPSTRPPDRPSRRAFLAATAAGVTVATSGCADRLSQTLNPISSDGLSLSITTLPADADREGIQIARHLRENLESVGISSSVDMRPRSEYLRQILISHSFDIYVGQLVNVTDPDVLYEALHSTFAAESGWQNPFGYTNRILDDLLEEQRQTTGEEREAAVADLADAIARELPFVPLCRPEEFRVVRTDNVSGWSDSLTERTGYLDLDTADGVSHLSALLTDTGPSRNINPIAAPYRDRGTIISLLYDSLGTVTDEGIVEPWLAQEWDWEDDRVTVTLRENVQFHDGETLTAEDVATTYRLLEDTSLGHADLASPSPQHRRHAVTVSEVEAVDDTTVRFWMEAARPVAERAFTVPILPAHIWTSVVEDHAEEEDEFEQGAHSLVDDEEIDPIGSGPFAYADSSEREYLTLERHDEHFTTNSDVDLPKPTLEEIVIGIDPSSLTAIDQVAAGTADVTISPLDANAVTRAESVDSEYVETIGVSSDTVYIVGFNTRSIPLSDPSIRHAIAQLVDKSWVVDAIFEGHGEPVAAPVGEEWVPGHLEWNDEDPVSPFFGQDGQLDEEAARIALEEARLPYDDDDDTFLDPTD